MNADLKKILLEIFTGRNEELETELKTAIFNSEDFYMMAMIYAVADTSETVRKLVEPWIRGFASTSRGLGGKGSEQLISLLYPGRGQQYLFPYPIYQQSETKNIEAQTVEKKKRIPFL